MNKIIDRKIEELRQERNNIKNKRLELKNEIKLISLEMRCTTFNIIKIIKLSNKLKAYQNKNNQLDDRCFQIHDNIMLLIDVDHDITMQELEENKSE